MRKFLINCVVVAIMAFIIILFRWDNCSISEAKTISFEERCKLAQEKYLQKNKIEILEVNLEDSFLKVSFKNKVSNNLCRIQIAEDEVFSKIVYDNIFLNDEEFKLKDLNKDIYYIRTSNDMCRGEFWIWMEYLEVKNHKHNNTEITEREIKPTCSDFGYKYYKCNDCSNIKKTQVDKLPHNYIEVKTKRIEPTCSKVGKMFYECSDCKHSYEETIDKLPHKLKTINIKESTCTTNGIKNIGCVNCEYKKEVTLELKDHNYKEVERVNATRDADGYIKYSCTGCEKSYKETMKRFIPALGGYMSHLNIPGVGLNTPVYESCADNGYMSLQSLCDASNCAVHFVLRGCNIIGDHNYQGFEKMKGSVPGVTKAYFNGRTYICTEKFNGHNIGSDLVSNSNNSISNMDHDLVLYTCNDSYKNITITLWKII